MIQVYRGAAELRAACDAIRARGQKLGFVPTMGALHAGHLALVEEARRHADRVLLSIFVNPTQFGPNEDFARYPRDFDGDLDKCRSAGVDLVFAPEPAEMYPPGETTRVTVGELGRYLCGASRPGHFDGVATVVTKLFALSGPCTAVFGRKDYQQLKIIERLTRDLLLPVRIVGHRTLREADGLALSSRNRYLSAEERQRALAIPRALGRAAAAFGAGRRSAAELTQLVERELSAAELRIDYAVLADPERLEPLPERLPERVLLAIAVHCGGTRLIDNLVLGEEAPP